MAKTANINVRIDPEVKADAEKLFSGFGITVSDAINIFLHQSIQMGGLPFEMRQPQYNATTHQAMAEARAIVGGRVEAKRYATARELFEELWDEALVQEARKRVAMGDDGKVTHEEMCKLLGITSEDIDRIEVEID